jgi:ABC-type multidrug transport system fused ATPase/permease subunit
VVSWVSLVSIARLNTIAENPPHVAARRPTADVRQVYAARAEQFRGEAQRLRLRFRAIWVLLSLAGVGLMGAVLVYLALGVSFALSAIVAGVCAMVACVATPLLLAAERDLELAERLAEINAQAIDRVERNWQAVPAPNAVAPEDRRALCDDLDLFGHASLCQLVCRARTPCGLARVANWLIVPAELDAIERRQAAVRELAGDLDYRHNLEAAASFIQNLGSRSERFAAWIRDRRDEGWLRPSLFAARVLTAAALISLLWFGVSTQTRMAAGFAFAGVLLVNVIFSIVFLGRVHTVFAVVSEGADDVSRYRRLIDTASRLTPRADLLLALHADVLQAKRGIRLLERLTWLSRFQNMKFALFFGLSVGTFLFFLVYVFLQFVVLWDFHVAGGLSIWRRKFGTSIDTALDAIGQIEALSSLAAVSAEHPDWVFPEFRTDGERIITATALGHPLLPPAACVRNDVTIGPPGTVLLVTGSNMSGKSTLLRALGTNVVLAQAGGPVCARSFLLPPVRVATVMRVTDSLEAGISLFMAELLSIRRVVDVADELDSDRQHVLLYLLDEILLGTNNAERQMAAAAVLSYLMSKNAIGAVSTHDLDLVKHPSIAAGCQPVYFRESFVTEGTETRMVFDYLMLPGVAPTTNVPFLLKAVGLPCPTDAAHR